MSDMQPQDWVTETLVPAPPSSLLLLGALSVQCFVKLMFSLTWRFAAAAKLLFCDGNLCLEELRDITSALTAPVCSEMAENIHLSLFLFFFSF